LGRWVAKQRQAYKAYQNPEKQHNLKYGILTAEKALKLANAGFAFDASGIRRTPKSKTDDGTDEAAGGDEENENDNSGEYENENHVAQYEQANDEGGLWQEQWTSQV